MEKVYDSFSGIYEVEKIINCKIYKNKKYYLIKWLYYPIHESTWEPKANLIYINNMLKTFEKKYPYSIDQNMYEIYCEEIKKRYNKSKNLKRINGIKTYHEFISKKKKNEFFTKSELKDINLDKLKIHLHLNLDKRQIKTKENDIIIDICESSSQDEYFASEEIDKVNRNENNNGIKQLILPVME